MNSRVASQTGYLLFLGAPFMCWKIT
jgi:hypothetical protein